MKRTALYIMSALLIATAWPQQGPPVTAGYEQFDQPSYWAGYKSGFKSTHVEGDDRTRMFRRCDLEIQARHYKKPDYDAGFVAGAVDADKQDEQHKREKAEADKREFERRSFEAGYRAEKKMHQHNGIARSMEEAAEVSADAKKWDNKSWTAGYRKANEEDTRP